MTTQDNGRKMTNPNDMVFKVGDRFKYKSTRRWRDENGDPRNHAYDCVCEVDAVDENGFHYRVIAVSNERNRPSWGEPHKIGGMSWLAVPLYRDDGTIFEEEAK